MVRFDAAWNPEFQKGLGWLNVFGVLGLRLGLGRPALFRIMPIYNCYQLTEDRSGFRVVAGWHLSPCQKKGFRVWGFRSLVVGVVAVSDPIEILLIGVPQFGTSKRIWQNPLFRFGVWRHVQHDLSNI